MIVQIRFAPKDVTSQPNEWLHHSVLISNLNHKDVTKQQELLDLLLSKQITPDEFEEAQRQRDEEFYATLNAIV